ncbi:N-acetyltransferase family protein [Kitasatospora sp. NPDC001119]
MAGTDPRFAAYAPAPAERHAPVIAVVAEATEDDVPALARLQARARGGSTDEWADRIHRALHGERSLVVTAKVSGEAVGYASAAYLPAHPADGAPAGHYLTGVTVDAAWRRRGLARLLTRRRMEWAWERDSAVWCFISARNRASLDLHRELGFVQVEFGASFQGVGFAGGEGRLLRADRPRTPSPDVAGTSRGSLPERHDPGPGPISTCDATTPTRRPASAHDASAREAPRPGDPAEPGVRPQPLAEA